MSRPRGYTVSPAERSKARANRMGISVADLTAQESAGLMWCPACREWLVKCTAFAANLSRSSGVQSSCRGCRADEFKRRRKAKRAEEKEASGDGDGGR